MTKEIKNYLKTIKGVSHTTFNPKTESVIRIHLIPPKKVNFSIPWVVIINGNDILPLSAGWGILFRCFIENVNNYQDQVIDDDKLLLIIDNTIEEMRKYFKKTLKSTLKDDLLDIISTIVDIAGKKEVEKEIGHLTLKQYGKYMNAVHRMDLMISSMVKDNHWNCNQKCLHCYAGEQDLAIVKELTTEGWKDIIDKCRDACIPQLTFTGGEPTLRSDLVELIDYSKWFVTRLNTNGVLLSKELCKQLYNASLDNVQITLYSHHEHIHNLLVGAPNFNKTIEGIKNAIDAGLSVSINTPLCDLNKDYLEMVKYLHEAFGLKYFTCSGLIVTGKACSDNSVNTTLDKDELFKIIAETKKYIDDNKLDLNFTTPGLISSLKLMDLKMMVPSCGACLSNMGIAPNGDVIPCQSWLSDNSLGNLITDDWKKIWNSKACLKIRKESIRISNLCPLTLKKMKGKE